MQETEGENSNWLGGIKGLKKLIDSGNLEFSLFFFFFSDRESWNMDM